MTFARLFLVTALWALLAGGAGAEIGLTPLRQVLDEKTRLVTYRVSNPSQRIVHGRVSWTDLTATGKGYVQATAEARAKMSAAPYLRVWPAQFRLEPGANTTITVALKDGVTLPAGERRSHLVIETSAARTPLRRAGGNLEADIGIGLSTPVIVRAGAGKASAKFGETRLLRTPEGYLELETNIEPAGEFSAYGRVDVLLKEAGAPQAPPRLLMTVDNVAAYIDAPGRVVSLPLNVERLPAGVLELRYAGRAEYEGVLIARRAFELAPPH
ncbi:MAG: hypothetical protein WD076_05795 [Parvularculaceae bacterium]